MDNKQQKTLIPERSEKNETGPMISQVYGYKRAARPQQMERAQTKPGDSLS